MTGIILRICLAALLTAGAGGSALAEKDASRAEEPADQAAFARSLADQVLERLGDARGSGDGAAMRIFYSILDVKPLWTGEDGLNDRARAAAEEIARAGEYGLDPGDYALPRLDETDPGMEKLARAELAFSRTVLKYVRHAKGGRVTADALGQLHDPPELPEPALVLTELAGTADAGAYLRGLHPDHPQFAALKKRLAALRAARDAPEKTAIPPGPVLRRGDTHEQVELLRTRFDVPAGESEKAHRFDGSVEAAVKTFQKKNGLKVDGILGPGTRGALGEDNTETQIVKILVNMERWRWLPDDLDDGTGIHVWANVPEFRARVVKEGETVFSEKTIVGKVTHQTPIFSDAVEWIALHPTWYVPDSIKVDDILPSLRRPTSTVVERYNLKLDCGRYGRNPNAIDWHRVDIRDCNVSQPPGPKSVLGDFKFKFPNRHAVYMHDTPEVHLFKADKRTFSHGCIRVRNPRRMAEILLDHDQGMSAQRIGEILDGPQTEHKAKFKAPVPVHITYFTMVVDDAGTLVSRPDYYGRDPRVANALNGRGELLPVPAMPQPRRERVSNRQPPEPTSWQDGFWSSMRN